MQRQELVLAYESQQGHLADAALAVQYYRRENSHRPPRLKRWRFVFWLKMRILRPRLKLPGWRSIPPAAPVTMN